MATLVETPTVVQAHGNIPKEIREYFGEVRSGTREISLAHMTSPGGWEEPGQTPEFNEYTLVLKGCLQVETRTDTHQVRAGQAILAPAGEWVRYSSPEEGGADYIAVCCPAFSPDTVHRDAEQ